MSFAQAERHGETVATSEAAIAKKMAVLRADAVLSEHPVSP
jgi:hypothetical protein